MVESVFRILKLLHGNHGTFQAPMGPEPRGCLSKRPMRFDNHGPVDPGLAPVRLF